MGGGEIHAFETGKDLTQDPDKPLSRTTGARWGKSAMGRSACLLAHGGTCGGTSDAFTLEL